MDQIVRPTYCQRDSNTLPMHRALSSSSWRHCNDRRSIVAVRNSVCRMTTVADVTNELVIALLKARNIRDTFNVLCPRSCFVQCSYSTRLMRSRVAPSVCRSAYLESFATFTRLSSMPECSRQQVLQEFQTSLTEMIYRRLLWLHHSVDRANGVRQWNKL